MQYVSSSVVHVAVRMRIYIYIYTHTHKILHSLLSRGGWRLWPATLHLDVQQRLNLLPADWALVCLCLERCSTAAAHAHVPAWQHSCIAFRRQANNTVTTLQLLTHATACTAAATGKSAALHAIDFLQLITNT